MSEQTSENSEDDTGGHVVGRGVGSPNPLRDPIAPKVDEDDAHVDEQPTA